FTAENIREVAKARWPKLESLSLYFGNERYGASGGVKDLAPILDGRGLPALRDLGLCNGEFADELAGVLGRSAVLRQLRVLDLSKGTLSDEGARSLLASAPAFAHLERIDLDENFLSDEMVEAVATLCPDVRTSYQREGDEDDRYASVGE
ncbi:MAG TPA: molybdenum metabolism regulator, partial [Polyangia bacterium]|nr:molybdenum metabolism regulator [Polyangia bacterium]